jgi:TatD DNase family protein
MRLVDTHCHLNLDEFNDDILDVINQSIKQNVYPLLIPGIDMKTSLKAIEIAEHFDHVYAAIGIHPNEASTWDESTAKLILELTQHPKVKAIGEIGLDYYWNKSSPEQQKKIFLAQLELAEGSGLPVIIHSRNSIQEVLSLLNVWFSKQPDKQKKLGVLHSFEGDLSEAKIAESINFFISLSGPVTYKNAKNKHQLACDLSIENLLLETDSPFLTPVPLRGKRNTPQNIILIAERIAQLRQTTLKCIAQETSKNANQLFAWEY